MILTTKTAQKALVYWQKRLRLQDWQLTVAVVRKSELSTGCFGEVSMSLIYRQAAISLMDPIDFEGTDSDRERDMEDSLVHELLHCVLTDCQIGTRDRDKKLTPAGIAEERAIDALSGALVELHRKGKK